MKSKKPKKNVISMSFGPLVDCSFNLPRVAQKLERLMGSSIVRLTDRKYMLDLQKRIQEDYHDTLLKRISKREADEVEKQLQKLLNPPEDIRDLERILFTSQSIVLMTELERARRMGNAGDEKVPKKIGEHPIVMVNSKTNALLMSKREKLMTVRQKNASELVKQGKRWERDRLRMAEEERVNEIETKKEREKMLEEHTLYIFDPEKADIMDMTRIRSRKFTECEIDLKNFLLSERESLRTRKINEQERLTQEKHLLTVAEERKLKGQLTSDLSSFEDRQDEIDGKHEKKDEVAMIGKLKLPMSAEEMKKKTANKDEDPQIARFKSAETVKEIYSLAEGIIAGDVIKGAQ
ncbi:hypothetical protein ACKWTF_000206 [Chironomus riparius]